MSKDNIKKIDLIRILSAKTGYSFSFSKKTMNDLIEIIIKILKSGNLNLKNLGTFKIINKKERLGRNPKTKEEFLITSRKSIIFISSKQMNTKLELDL